MIPGDLLSAFPHRQFHTLPGLLDSWAALPNSYPNALRAMQGGSLYHFYDGLWYDPTERRTHDLPCERRTRYRLSQPDTVNPLKAIQNYIDILLTDDTIFCSQFLLLAIPSETIFVSLLANQETALAFNSNMNLQNNKF